VTAPKRPWTVFVREVGPTFTFSTEANARQRARDLTAGEYAEVLVWNKELFYDDPVLLRRWIYRDGECADQQVFPHGGSAWETLTHLTTTTEKETI
jgi:hypothetical protein